MYYVLEQIMAAEKAQRFQQEGNQRDVGAYAQNYGAHREGISMKEVAEYYTEWANSNRYEVVIMLLSNAALIPMKQ
jgi:hypothetical protein